MKSTTVNPASGNMKPGLVIRRTSTLSIFIVILAAASVAAQDKYNSAMLRNIDAIYQARSLEEYQNAINAFERIAAAEKNKFEPFYYIAFGDIMMAATEPNGFKKDGYLDRALTAIEKANAIRPNDSETTALEGFVHMLRVTVDPQSRGAEFSEKAFTAFNKSLALNPENPRALALLGQMQYGTAQFFGNGTKDACVTLNSALQKFDSHKSPDILAPHWGRTIAENATANCK